MLFTAVCILLGLLIFWAHVATIMYVRKSIKDAKSSKEECYCPQCDTVMSHDTFFGLRVYKCTKGHQFIARGKWRLTPMHQTVSSQR